MYATMMPGDFSWTLYEQDEKITLEQLQEVIGGTISMIRVNGVDIFHHDEGKLIGFAPTLGLLGEGEDEVLDVMFGPLFACGCDREGYSIPNLSEEDLARIRPSKERSVLYSGFSVPAVVMVAPHDE